MAMMAMTTNNSINVNGSSSAFILALASTGIRRAARMAMLAIRHRGALRKA